jgi:threonine dehydrogenase-like Zn-dependent dehydrogenase
VVKAAVTVAPRRIEVIDEEEPSREPGLARVRIGAVGLCGSDLHLFLGDHPYSRFPLTQGHELAGTVVDLPEDYRGGLRPGDIVAVEPYFSCGRCYPCRRGRWNCCTELRVLGAHVPGGLKEVIAVPVEKLHATQGLDAELTAMVEPISIGVMAVERGEVAPDDTVVVFGAGPIGLAILLACKDKGTGVTVLDIVEPRLALAREVGADLVLNSRDVSFRGAIDSWTNGDGPAVVFDATGVPAVIRTCVDLVAPAGRVVVVGLSLEEVAIPVVDFTRKELTILGSRAGLFPDAVRLVERNRELVRDLITHRYPLEETQAALTFALENPAEAEKVIVLVTPNRATGVPAA